MKTLSIAIGLAFSGILGAAIFFAFQDDAVPDKMAEVMIVGNQTKKTLGEFFTEKKKAPAQSEQADAPAASSYANFCYGGSPTGVLSAGRGSW